MWVQITTEGWKHDRTIRFESRSWEDGVAVFPCSPAMVHFDRDDEARELISLGHGRQIASEAEAIAIALSFPERDRVLFRQMAPGERTIIPIPRAGNEEDICRLIGLLASPWVRHALKV